MKQYLDLLQDILDNGTYKMDRTGTGTLEVFGRQLRFDLEKGFPLVTTKRVFWRGIVAEMLWFISGSTNIKPLVDQDVNIWNAWPHKHYCQTVEEISMEHFVWKIKNDERFASNYGELGPVYGFQWRKTRGKMQSLGYMHEVDASFDDSEYESIDQLQSAIELLKKDPNSRRNIVSAWNVADIPAMIPSGLPPCHYAFQFLGRGKKLDMMLQIRSWDTVLGAPFNIAQYALLVHLIAKQVNMIPGELIINSGSTHIYVNHVQQVIEQLRRDPLPLPTLEIASGVESIDDYRPEHIILHGYQHHAAISAPVAV